jgi:hypothetical protein
VKDVNVVATKWPKMVVKWPFIIYVVVFDPIKILTCWGLQNNNQNLSFVKAINEVGKKWPEILIKLPTSSF